MQNITFNREDRICRTELPDDEVSVATDDDTCLPVGRVAIQLVKIY